MIILQCGSRGVCVMCHVRAPHNSHWLQLDHARRQLRLIHRALYILGTRATFAVSLNYTIYGIIWCPCWGKTIHQRVNISYTGSLSRCVLCVPFRRSVCNGWLSNTRCVYVLYIYLSHVRGPRIRLFNHVRLHNCCLCSDIHDLPKKPGFDPSFGDTSVVAQSM